MKILIYGFGRMGLTHYGILNALYSNLEFTIIEPSLILRKLIKNNINANFYADDSILNKPFDITLITTPPFIHSNLIEKSIKRGDNKIFVEKPFGGFTNTKISMQSNLKNIYVGYVLRFNPCIQWVKSNIDIKNIKSIDGKYLSNTLTKKPKGWRNGNFSGVLNEVGSHVIDLIHFILNDYNFKVKDSEKRSIVSDVDDIVQANLISRNNIDISLYFNWVKREIRKPIFELKIGMNDDSFYHVDQQQIKHFNSNEEIIFSTSVTDIAEKIPFYLRGIDFTKQMIELFNGPKNMATINDGINVNKLMNKIINYENNFRG